ncbi:MAG TPA: HD domain-containing phosphohydrolase [Gemmatimonadales bacterium]|jgi:putative two-component system response regulator
MTSPLAAVRVLVVDDERAVAAAVARRLEKDGAICVTSNSGDDARKQLAAGRFDVMVSDVQMPGRSGLELLDDAQEVADPPAVILMAGDGDGTGGAAALSRGADGFARKPLDVELLAHEASMAVELRSLRRVLGAAAVSRAAGPVLLVLGEIVNAFEKADPFRAGYSTRTARIVAQLAVPLGLDAEKLALAARIHDLGMLAVPIAEQHTEGPPDRTSQHLIRVHPTLGARWIERLGADRTMVAAVAAHHERIDGNGYPGGLKGEDIPAEARALGTAAAVAAMSGPRPWREKMDPAEIIAQVEKGRGTQFGASEADAVLEILRRAPALVG